MTPLVSVILPYRDAGETVARAIDGVLDGDVEVLAIDDGSRDDGPARVAAIDDPRVRRLSTGGAGLVAALERGRAEARGRWIARMDADDVSRPGRFAAQVAALEADPRLAAVGARVTCPGAGEGLRAYVAWQNALLSPAEHARDLFVEAPLCHPSVTLRREALDAVGGWRDPGWPEDYDLWLRLDAAGWRLAKVPEPLLEWHHTEGRATFTHPRYAPARLREARAAFLAPRLTGRPFAIWGAGRTGKRLARALEAHGVCPEAWIDIDPAKIGRRARGAPILGPDAAESSLAGTFLVVAVGARGARDEVRARLTRLGLEEMAHFRCAA
ncbi:MAG: glycosyltransferase family 2 protein [Myxococcota bacterium]|nr:glycosyltransferase family 2 protein [Myxococcota bacterium]